MLACSAGCGVPSGSTYLFPRPPAHPIFCQVAVTWRWGYKYTLPSGNQQPTTNQTTSLVVVREMSSGISLLQTRHWHPRPSPLSCLRGVKKYAMPHVWWGDQGDWECVPSIDSVFCRYFSVFWISHDVNDVNNRHYIIRITSLFRSCKSANEYFRSQYMYDLIKLPHANTYYVLLMWSHCHGVV